MSLPLSSLDRARLKLELVRIEGMLIDPKLDGLELTHLQPLRDEIAQRLRGGGRVGEPAQLGLGLRR